MSRRAAGRRAVIRWALRLWRREWRQQLLVLTLLTVAVAAAVAGSSTALAASSDASGRFGSAGGLVRLDGGDPAAARAGIEAAGARFGTVQVIAHATLDVPGSVEQLDARDQDPHGPFGRPMLALRQGRYPTAPGEVALTRGAADRYGARIGSTITLGDDSRRTVVGIVENPADLREDFALVAPGSLPSPDSYTVLVDRPDRRRLRRPRRRTSRSSCAGRAEGP